MSVTSLKPGDKVMFDGRPMTFIRRDRWSRECFFQCDDFIGVNGPGDKGICTTTDHRVNKLCTRAGGTQ